MRVVEDGFGERDVAGMDVTVGADGEVTAMGFEGELDAGVGRPTAIAAVRNRGAVAPGSDVGRSPTMRPGPRPPWGARAAPRPGERDEADRDAPTLVREVEVSCARTVEKRAPAAEASPASASASTSWKPVTTVARALALPNPIAEGKSPAFGQQATCRRRTSVSIGT